MAPSFLRSRTARYEAFIHGVMAVVASGTLRWPVSKIADTYSEMVERADLLETQINSARVPGEVDSEGQLPYKTLSSLIQDYVNYRAGDPPAEWIVKADLPGPRPR